ncbi:MAG: hypothetical protein GX086_09985 [Alcaligenaceae bacterium]|nr:hypothetical protein [Alcaligenaceae bacterium]
MQVLFGARFAQQWEGIDPQVMMAEWGQELAGYSGEEIKRGLDACRRMSKGFAPTLPEFMAMCRPPINPEAAFYEAVQGMTDRRRGERGSWSHPAIYHAGVEVGQHDLLNCGYSVLKVRWEKALSNQLAKAQWAEIPEAQVALPAPAKTKTSEAEAQKAMERLGAGDVLNKSCKDHKAWARRILENPKSKTPAAVAMAQRALGEVAA